MFPLFLSPLPSQLSTFVLFSPLHPNGSLLVDWSSILGLAYLSLTQMTMQVSKINRRPETFGKLLSNNNKPARDQVICDLPYWLMGIDDI